MRKEEEKRKQKKKRKKDKEKKKEKWEKKKEEEEKDMQERGTSFADSGGDCLPITWGPALAILDLSRRRGRAGKR